MADIVERSNPNNEYTASGTDVSTVQIAANAANGDVIKIFGNATFSQIVTNAYTVRTFTIQSANENQQTVNVSAGRCYDLNTASQTYNFTFENLFFQGDNSAIYAHGRFIILSNNDCNLTLNLNNVTFKQFKAKKNPSKPSQLGLGGVIRTGTNTNSLTLQGSSVEMIENTASQGGAISVLAKGLTSTVNNLTFKNNVASDDHGGAIFSTGPLTITADNLTFEGNSTNNGQGGAIYATNSVTITANTLLVKDNTSTKHAGGIRVSTNDLLKISGNSITFDGNIANDNDGGALCANNIEIIGTGTNPVIKFEKNESKNIAGAIVGYTQLTLKTGSFYFDKNKLTNSYTGDRSGGAIETSNLSITEAKVASFTNNVSLHAGGAVNLGYTGSGTIEAETILFQNNSASDYGGAINGGTFAFSGSGATATFTGNTAGQGNDIYLIGTSGTVLSFTNSGTYSFDGGIYLENANAQTVINQAQVTISGRKNDTTNVYQLQNVTISNGGKLTANLDYIDSLTGTFNVAGATDETKGTLELNVSEDAVKKLNADSFKVVRTDKGEVIKTGDGTLQLCNEAQDLIDINGLVVSSGRMDILGYMTGGITVEPDSVFSPGNSVGDARFGGGYELKEDAMLLIEQDASGIDTLTATSFDIDSNSIIDFAADSLQPGASYDIIFQTDSEGNPKNFTGAQATDDFWNNLLTPESAYYWNLTVSGNVVRASVDPNAVPEPSTWALLLLGAAGLLYVRKRNN